MAYKIANIKWLRDQGWSISSSYASSLCPTYNEIVNEIPKGSTTVNVNGTCIATSKAYANNQLVCESDITIGPAVDCSEYEFENQNPEISQGAFVSALIATSNYNKEQLSWTINDNWITAVTSVSYTPAPGVILWAYGCDVEANPTTRERTGSVTFTSTNGCSFLATCTQHGAEWVDLGLPSGKLWRAWNVGSSLEIEYGNYYQYGKGSRQYAATSAETSYTGTENPLSSSLDAATQALNNANVHMPTVTEYKELTANTTYSNVTINGISGGKFTSSNGNYIFLPFGGEYNNGTKELVGIDGYYLSSTPIGSTSIHRMIVNSNGTHYDGNYRTLGLMVRPVSGTTTDTCTCSQINVSMTELNISADSALTQVGNITTNDCAPNVTYESTQPTWLSGVTTDTNNIRIKCSENTTYNSRSGSVNVKMNGNTCSTVNVTQAGKAEEDETYTVYVTSEPNESSCARVLIADGGSIEFTLSIYVGGTTHTLKYLVNNRQEFGETLERFGTINVPFGQISSFDFNCLSTNTGNILKANSSSSNGNKLPQLTTQWSTLDSNTELWEGGIIPILCTGDENGNRFVVSWDINTVKKTIVIYYRYQQIG